MSGNLTAGLVTVGAVAAGTAYLVNRQRKTCEDHEELLDNVCVPKCTPPDVVRDEDKNCTETCKNPELQFVQNHCVPKCPEGVTRDENFACKTTCDNETLELVNNTSCEEKCEEGKERDQATKKCKEIICPDGTHLWKGECKPNCSDGETRNPDTDDCQITCEPNQDKVGDECKEKCVVGATRNPTTHECECPEGQEVVNDIVCRKKCPANKPRNSEGFCEIQCDDGLQSVKLDYCSNNDLLQQCNIDSDCSDGKVCNRFSGFCSMPRNPLDVCMVANDCKNKNCTNNECAVCTGGTCESKADLYGPCTGGITCNDNLVCKSKKCAYTLIKGNAEKSKLQNGDLCAKNEECMSGICHFRNQEYSWLPVLPDWVPKPTISTTGVCQAKIGDHCRLNKDNLKLVQTNMAGEAPDPCIQSQTCGSVCPYASSCSNVMNSKDDIWGKCLKQLKTSCTQHLDCASANCIGGLCAPCTTNTNCHGSSKCDVASGICKLNTA